MWFAQLVTVNLGAYIYSYQANIIQPLGPCTWVTGYSKSKDTRLQQTYHCWTYFYCPSWEGQAQTLSRGHPQTYLDDLLQTHNRLITSAR